MFESLIADWIDHRRASGCAKGTLLTQGTWLRAYARYVGPGAGLDAFNAARLQRWIARERDAGKRPRTVRGAILAARAFGRWLVETGRKSDNPAESVPMPRLDAVRRKYASDEEVFAMLDACDRLTPIRRAACARAALSLLVFGGLRRAELLGLQVDDVDLKTGAVYVDHGKGDKARTVYLPEEGVESVAAWLQQRGTCRHDFLLDFDGSRRIGDQGLRTLVEQVRAAAGLRASAHLVPHTLRHAYATRLLRNGVDMETIRVNLGHANLVTTAMYVHTSPEVQRASAQAAAQRPDKEPAAPKEEPAKETRPRLSTWRQRVQMRAIEGGRAQ